VLGEVLRKRLHNEALGEVFPEYQVKMHEFVRG